LTGRLLFYRPGGAAMNWVEKINEAIGFIERNLTDDITVESVAKAVNYSPSILQTQFGALTGYSIGEYVRFRRLTCALGDIEEDRLSITDIAFKYGYETVEAFSKAFKRFFGVPPSKIEKSGLQCCKFAPIRIDFKMQGGFSMTRNIIPGLRPVTWSDPQRQSEFVNSVLSALNATGETLTYDYVCAVSGCAFRTSFSMKGWNHGNYHAVHTPPIIEHTFRMLGYCVKHIVRGDYETDRKSIMDSIDRGVPVITLEGVINCADACVISGYDNDGAVLLGYNPFMDVQDDHTEPCDITGYFRKSAWHDGFFAQGSKGRILLVEGKCEKPSAQDAFHATLRLAARLIGDGAMADGQHNGLAAHRAFANALLTYRWDDNFEPYLNVMCNYKQYLDRQYAAKYLRDNGRTDLARYYDEISDTVRRMGNMIPQDFTAGDMFSDRENLRPYADAILEICELEREFLSHIEPLIR
jgi:AraC-like DNA-binding protein